MNYTLLITAAGESSGPSENEKSRFLATHGGMSLIEKAIASFAGFSKLIIGLAKSEAGQLLGDRIFEKYPDAEVVAIPTNRGATATAAACLGKKINQPLVIASGDSWVNPGVSDPIIYEFIEGGWEAGTIVHRSDSPIFSYLRLDGSGSVKEVVEKSVVGTFATTGIFMFSSPQTFLRAAQWTMENQITTLGNYYLSATLNKIIFDGEDIFYKNVGESNFHFPKAQNGT